ncbi:hypothetical protein FQA39_LY02728 [Lamprigera yunnana]|nr:hypothetical protein FQA39_LY02728 [Lamprigera yunnana]
MRELSRPLMSLRDMTGVTTLFEALKPEFFDYLVSSTKMISRYSPDSKTFTASSLALHMGTTLKLVCDIARKMIIKKSKSLPVDDQELFLISSESRSPPTTSSFDEDEEETNVSSKKIEMAESRSPPTTASSDEVLLHLLISNMSSTLREKHLHAQAREMAFNGYQWLKSQIEDQCTKEIKEKLSTATGVSVRTIEKIIKEGSTSHESKTDKRSKIPRKN